MTESVIVDGHPEFVRPGQVQAAVERDEAVVAISQVAQGMSRDFLRALAAKDSYYYPDLPEFPAIPRIVGTEVSETYSYWGDSDAEQTKNSVWGLANSVAAATIARTDELRDKKHGLSKRSIKLKDGIAISPYRYLFNELIPGYVDDLSVLLEAHDDLEIATSVGGVGAEKPYVTGFNSPHRADIGDYAGVAAEELFDAYAPCEQMIPRSQAIEIARQTAGIALPQLLQFVGSGELDLVTGRGNETIRFSVDPDNSIVSDENSPWAWINDLLERRGE